MAECFFSSFSLSAFPNFLPFFFPFISSSLSPPSLLVISLCRLVFDPLFLPSYFSFPFMSSFPFLPISYHFLSSFLPSFLLFSLMVPPFLCSIQFLFPSSLSPLLPPPLYRSSCLPSSTILPIYFPSPLFFLLSYTFLSLSLPSFASSPCPSLLPSLFLFSFSFLPFFSLISFQCTISSLLSFYFSDFLSPFLVPFLFPFLFSIIVPFLPSFQLSFYLYFISSSLSSSSSHYFHLPLFNLILPFPLFSILPLSFFLSSVFFPS